MPNPIMNDAKIITNIVAFVLNIIKSFLYLFFSLNVYFNLNLIVTHLEGEMPSEGKEMPSMTILRTIVFFP